MTMNPSTGQQLRRSRMSSNNSNNHHNFHVKSLGTGALSPPPTTTTSNSKKKPTITIRSNVKSLAIGTLSKGSPSRAAVQKFIRSSQTSHTSSSFLSSSKDDSIGGSSSSITASNSATDDSSSYILPPCLDGTSHASDTFFDGDDVDDSDPYLSQRRQRPLKKEPDIPRCCPPQQQQQQHPSRSDTPTSGGCAAGATPLADDSILSPGTFRSLLTASFPSSLTLSSYLVPKSLNFASPRSSENNVDRSSPASSTDEDFVLHFEAAATPKVTKAQQLQKYWKSMITRNEQQNGYTHHQTAHAYYSLGHAYMNDIENQATRIDDACSAFETSARIYKDLYGPSHLSVALALDAYGHAMMMQAKKRFGSKNYNNNKKIQILVQAKSALDEAFVIRHKELGVWHVDTVETYNKIASVHLHLGNYKDALVLYKEVYLVRKAIFGGKNHPSVAITAHTIANVLLKSCKPQEAHTYYDVALKIYKEMDLPTDHPTVAKLLTDRSSLDRVAAKTSNGNGVVVGFSPSWSSSSSSPSSCSATVKASGAGPAAGYF